MALLCIATGGAVHSTFMHISRLHWRSCQRQATSIACRQARSPVVDVEVVSPSIEAMSKFLLPPQRETFGLNIKLVQFLTSKSSFRSRVAQVLPCSMGTVGRGIYVRSIPKALADRAEGQVLVTARILTGKALTIDVREVKVKAPFLPIAGLSASIMMMLMLGRKVLPLPAPVALPSGLPNLSDLMASSTAATAAGLAMVAEAGSSMKRNFAKLHSLGYDSIRCTGLSTGEELVVYNEDQVEIVNIEEY